MAWGRSKVLVEYIDSFGTCSPNPGETLRMDRLEGSHVQTILVTSGLCMEDHFVIQARETVYRGERPWVCQRCANYALCQICGASLARAPGADHMEDNGRIVHTPILGFKPACSNQDCPRYRPRKAGMGEDEIT